MSGGPGLSPGNSVQSTASPKLTRPPPPSPSRPRSWDMDVQLIYRMNMERFTRARSVRLCFGEHGYGLIGVQRSQLPGFCLIWIRKTTSQVAWFAAVWLCGEHPPASCSMTIDQPVGDMMQRESGVDARIGDLGTERNANHGFAILPPNDFTGFQPRFRRIRRRKT